ncbi:hypothetical protein CTRI78_v009661 [Colletotrichum trifolii]|uniref:Uncharacterized protein n=1 Tax=Colletotrichum trifolii TaxID=5466 RepID=A0A4R8QQ42_COLTR|nr:hypothetical protein CTRI78_v009661 [Colletotrichum trifolii]
MMSLLVISSAIWRRTAHALTSWLKIPAGLSTDLPKASQKKRPGPRWILFSSGREVL